MKDMPVQQVNLSTTDGDLGVLAGHVPSILQLKPGLIEIFQNTNDKQHFFGNSNSLALTMVFNIHHHSSSEWRIRHGQP